MKFHTVPIEEKWINDLLILSGLNLGEGYLTADYFTKVINSSNYEGFCVIKNEQLIAFLVYYKTNAKEVVSTLKDNNLEPFLDESIICLDTMVVSSNYRNNGLGKSLINKVIEANKLNTGFIMYTWKQAGVINMKRIADYFLFESKSEYPNLWKKDCENNFFNCPVKENENQKCKCSCQLYYRKQEK